MLSAFHGGLHLDNHKALATQRPLTTAALPATLVYPLHGRGGRNAEPVVEIGERVLKGQVIARDDSGLNPPLHAASSGIVAAIDERPVPHPSGLDDRCIVIETDGQDEAIAFEGVSDPATLTADALRARIHEAGIVGLGGAAFPTAVKVDPGDARAIDTLVLNGAECEPYITCDDMLLRHDTDDVLAGAAILMQILDVDRCLIGIENDMPEAIAALEQALTERQDPRIRLVPVPAVYPTGGEKQLIKVLTGREVPSKGIPADVGVICQNVGTAAAIARAIVRGEPLIERIVTVTGSGVVAPANLRVRIGTPIAELVTQCGGYTERAERLILGGPMMGFALPTDELPIVKAANCVLVAAPQEAIGPKQALACIRCGSCQDACPINLLPQQLYWFGRSDQLDRAADYHLADCIECGCCDVVCPSHIPLVQYFRATKSKLAARDRERRTADHARERFEARQARKEREKLEKAEALKRKKALLELAPEIQKSMDQAKADAAAKAGASAESRPEQA